jgi:hypothetical protein
MPGFLLHEGAVVTCAHAGPASPTVPNPRVKVFGMSTVLASVPYKITGCTFPAMTSGASPPCVTAQWTTASLRVKSMGQPLVLIDSQATCVPNGTPLIIGATLTKVTAI